MGLGISRRRDTDPIVPGVSSATPPALRPERPMGAEKAWNGDLQTPCGSAGEARLYNASAEAGAPSPLVPFRLAGRRTARGRMANSEWRITQNGSTREKEGHSMPRRW